MTDTPLSDDVVETVATAIYESIFVDEWTGGNGVEAAQYRQAARAALEAARYGEIVKALQRAEQFMRDLATTDAIIMAGTLEAEADDARAILSSIGASQP